MSTDQLNQLQRGQNVRLVTDDGAEIALQIADVSGGGGVHTITVSDAGEQAVDQAGTDQPAAQQPGAESSPGEQPPE